MHQKPPLFVSHLPLPPPLWSVKSDIHTDISAVWILFLPPVAENDIMVYDTLFWSEPSLFPRVSHLKSSWRRPLRLCRRTSEVDGMTDLIEAVGSDRTRRPSDRSSHVLRCSLWEARLWRRTCTDGQRGDQWRNLQYVSGGAAALFQVNKWKDLKDYVSLVGLAKLFSGKYLDLCPHRGWDTFDNY